MEQKRDTRPNVIVILADDMGFADLGCTGSEVRTPNIDSLAKDGILLSAVYNCARCCPTRASLLTGLYPHNAGIGHMGANLGTPGYQGFPRPDTTAARVRPVLWHHGRGHALLLAALPAGRRSPRRNHSR